MTDEIRESLAPVEPRFRRIYLMRHGDVRYFEPGQVPRHHDEVLLSPEGVRQAQAAAAALAEVPFDRVVTSHLRRTQQTAELVLGGRPLTAVAHEDLGEIKPASLIEIAPDQMQATLTRAFTGAVAPDDQFLGGETFGSLLARVIGRLEKLVADDAWRHLLVVAHGGVNRAILTHALGTGVPGFGRLEQDAACLNVIDVDERGNFLVRLVNFTAYNPAKLGLHLTTMQQMYHDYLAFLASFEDGA